VRSAPRFKRILGRSALFVLPASALWALLPVLARDALELGSGGYGLLLGSVGFGAIAGALLLPRLRARIGSSALVAVATLAYTGALLVVGLSGSVAAAGPALVLAGLGWVGVLSTLNASAQQILPDWTRARSLAFYTLVLMGGQALGSVLWGVVAAEAGLDAAWLAAGALLLLGVAVGVGRLPLHGPLPDVERAQLWADPEAATDAAPDAGPVLVTAEWRVADEHRAAFLAAMGPVGRSRRRTGAQRWGLFRDLADPELYLETFTVATWQEHLRQHLERGTAGDRAHEERARALTVDGEGPRVRHLLHGAAHEP
jgi:MFS family permease